VNQQLTDPAPINKESAKMDYSVIVSARAWIG
jgi:hypothetical protein